MNYSNLDLVLEQGVGDDEVLDIIFWTTIMSRRTAFPFGIMALTFAELQEQEKQEDEHHYCKRIEHDVHCNTRH